MRYQVAVPVLQGAVVQGFHLARLLTDRKAFMLSYGIEPHPSSYIYDVTTCDECYPERVESDWDLARLIFGEQAMMGDDLAVIARGWTVDDDVGHRCREHRDTGEHPAITAQLRRRSEKD